MSLSSASPLAGWRSVWARWRKPIKLVGIAAVLALAAYLLWRALRPYSLAELGAAVSAIPAARLAGAAGFAGASYFCLTFFDYLGLRYVGAPLPYRKAALASFCSLSLGHTLGLAGASAGAVRYRFYSRWGLSAEQVAKLVLFCGVTVALGHLALAGAALLADPGLGERALRLDAGAVRAVALACLAAPVLYLAAAALLPGGFTVFGRSLRMPTFRLALAQVLVAIVNFACVAACMHEALAAISDAGYAEVAGAYAAANAATMITHAPGGLGVIETVVQRLLPQSDLIGGLLVYRLIYFLGPLAIGALTLLGAELVFRRRAGG